MNPDKQRIKIAEACGAQWHHPWDVEANIRRDDILMLGFYRQSLCYVHHGAFWEDGKMINIDIPDYLNDLNAMHEAEKTLARIPRIEYKSILNQITRGEHDNLYEHHNDVFATAAQRAEAFLRALNLWETDK